MASTSCRTHAIARNKVRKLLKTSAAECRLTYMEFASEYTRGVIAIAGNFVYNCGCFCLSSHLFLPAILMFVFACKLLVFLPAKAGNFAC